MFGKLLLLSILVSRLLFSYIRKSRFPRSSATDVGITMLEASARAGLNSAVTNTRVLSMSVYLRRP